MSVSRDILYAIFAKTGVGLENKASVINFGTNGDLSEEYKQKKNKEILTNYDETLIRTIPKGNYMRYTVMGSPNEKIVLRLTILEGYKIYKIKNSDCEIIRYSNGGLVLKYFYGLNEDLPIVTIDEMSNDDFIEKLYEIGLPKGTIIDRSD